MDRPTKHGSRPVWSPRRLEVADLITNRFAFTDALEAYELLEDGSLPSLAILLEYGHADKVTTIELHGEAKKSPATDLDGVGLIGAGRFARSVLLPAARAAGFGGWTAISSTGGSSAVSIGETFGFAQAVSDGHRVIGDISTRTVFVATRHDTHATFVQKALEAGKHVFCEKPLAISEDELDAVTEAYRRSTGVLMVGFNRRWSPAIAETKTVLGRSDGRQIIYRVNAGSLSEDHWLMDRRQGGGCSERPVISLTPAARVNQGPSAVLTLTSGAGELLLDGDFTIALGYPNGSQAVIIYASDSSTQPGKERLEILGSGRSIIIDDFNTLVAYGPTWTMKRRYRPADKGHHRELQVFAELVRGIRDADEIAGSAFLTSRVAFAAVRSATTGQVVHLTP